LELTDDCNPVKIYLPIFYIYRYTTAYQAMTQDGADTVIFGDVTTLTYVEQAKNPTAFFSLIYAFQMQLAVHKPEQTQNLPKEYGQR
jgi:hypothetical protein